MKIDVQLLLFQVALAIAMFFLINWLGRHSKPFGYMPLSLFAQVDVAPAFNLTFRVLTPVVFLILVSAGLYWLNLDRLTHNIFLVAVFYFAFRLLFNGVMERWGLLNWSMVTIHLILTVSLSWLSYRYLIVERSNLLPNFETISNELWLVIAGFLYVLFNKIRWSSRGTEGRKLAYVLSRYAMYRKRYGGIIRGHTQNTKLEALVYAVIIMEAFNRPKLHRMFERALFTIGLAKTLGIMQVTTDKPISDDRSIELGAAKLMTHCREAFVGSRLQEHLKLYGLSQLEDRLRYYERDVLHETLVKYNYSGDYAREALDLYDIILSRFYSNCKDSLLVPAA